jgi:hypothetical protein
LQIAQFATLLKQPTQCEFWFGVPQTAPQITRLSRVSIAHSYERTFDWFEYLLCLVHCDVQVSLICCARTSDSRHNTLPRCENVESLHTSCDTVVRLPFCRRESMFR